MRSTLATEVPPNFITRRAMTDLDWKHGPGSGEPDGRSHPTKSGRICDAPAAGVNAAAGFRVLRDARYAGSSARRGRTKEDKRAAAS
ncbi:hypothetical protein MSC49_30410 [Methylosinus sp. C49]|nr:hypothetical protein MSC49_30410 [Methylosinus sp. C49]